ncbi:hypothetical protein RND81_07G108200 [Saponaria officinalis]|uniref:Uncharacterized protein n=1 Tax=Saponaria officinalis TaxID=3572 RepID=A0AAW1JM42_SAPOF
MQETSKEWCYTKILIFFIILHLLNSSSLSAAQTISSFSINNSPWKLTQNITLLSPNFQRIKRDKQNKIISHKNTPKTHISIKSIEA